MSTWCCDCFDRLIERCGNKGMSIIAFKDGDYRIFYIQARSFEKEDVEEFDKDDPVTGYKSWPEIRNKNGELVPFSISQQISISYCPSCGANLKEIINKSVSEFDSLSEIHFPYRD